MFTAQEYVNYFIRYYYESYSLWSHGIRKWVEQDINELMSKERTLKYLKDYITIITR